MQTNALKNPFNGYTENMNNTIGKEQRSRRRFGMVYGVVLPSRKHIVAVPPHCLPKSMPYNYRADKRGQRGQENPPNTV